MTMSRAWRKCWLLAVMAVLGVGGCTRPGVVQVQGYVEGEFVYVSAPLAGPLQKLSVQRGDTVKPGNPLFVIDPTVAKANLDQSQASLAFSTKDFERQQQLSLSPGSASIRDLQLSRAARDQDFGRVAQAQWNYDQMHQVASQDALVFDTLYREGEWVDAGHPVVELLPPQNIEVRAFVPEMQVGRLHPGDKAEVYVDGVSEPFVGRLAYIFPQSEYTPPVIYSEESRAKLVFMVEVIFDPAVAIRLHPGQPVDVRFTPQP